MTPTEVVEAQYDDYTVKDGAIVRLVMGR